MISSMCRKGVTAGAEVTVVGSRNSRALLSVRGKGMRISLRACWRWATVQSLIEVVGFGDGDWSLGLAALWPRVGCREDGHTEAQPGRMAITCPAMWMATAPVRMW